jgi:hypothetical protein
MKNLDLDGYAPKNQSFLINFNGIFEEHQKSKFVDEIWEKYVRSKYILT